MLPTFALLGIAVGSFLNVVIERLPQGQSLLNPPSHCPSCNHRLAPYDLIPVFSYVILRGNCRYCSDSIPRRIFWVELTTGLLFAFLWWNYGISIRLGIVSVYSCLFIAIFVIDLECGLILNKLIYPAIPITIGLVFLRPELTIINSLIGGGIGFVFLLLPAVISRGAMGWGDVKMGALIGLMSGFPLIFVNLFIAVITGGTTACVLLLLRRKKRRETIPFGPFLAAASIITLLWGNAIWEWYIHP